MSRLLRLAPRYACLLLLVVASMVRPYLIVACEVHATAFAHASSPHDHGGEHDADPATAGAHGEHDDQLTGDGGVVPVPSFAFQPAPLAPAEPVRVRPSPPREDVRGTRLFRPPIC